jgi:hypothetical protein
VQSTVGSFVAKNQWDAHGLCKDLIATIRPADLAQVKATLPGIPEARLRRGFNLAPGTPGVPPGKPAKIIATMDFDPR